MAEYNEQKRVLTVKLVYYGPALSGKTTNLMRLHDLIAPALKGDIMVMETKNDRTLFFDLLPLGVKAPSGLELRFKLFTVPGQVAHDGTRKAVLSRADGVAFVADSQRTQSINNGESFDNLAENARRVGLDFERLPLVVQFNKRDLPDILSEEEIVGRWAAAPWPLVFAAALTGTGVRETFAALLRETWRTLDGEFELAARHGLSADALVAAALEGDR
ncbi:MAG: GTPase domain-containing protein [Rhodocyclales bacterium]|nr:GTPase domain-containing protein [Rhodocyclales bacterium]